MREVIYRCNRCQKILSDHTGCVHVPHVHVKGVVGIAYFVKKAGRWAEKNIVGGEGQFCVECMLTIIGDCAQQVRERVMEDDDERYKTIDKAVAQGAEAKTA